MRKIKLFIATLAMCAITTIPVFAEWKQEIDGRWWYQNDDGSYPANQWQEIGGKQYYFGVDGYMLANTTTPDGKQVGADGALVQDAQPQSCSNLIYSADSVTTALTISDYKLENYGSTYHIFEITNNSPYTIELNINETAKDSYGNIIGAHSTRQEDIPSGCTVFVNNMFFDVKNIGWFDTTIQAKQDTSYIPVLQNVSMSTTKTKNAVIVSTTNAGSIPVEFLQASAMFFKGGKLVYYSSTYITDSDYELKPGATLSEQIRCYEDFDSVKVHITGRRSKWSQ